MRFPGCSFPLVLLASLFLTVGATMAAAAARNKRGFLTVDKHLPIVAEWEID